MQDAPKEHWSIPYVSVPFLPSLKQNFIAYRSSKVSSCLDCIFEIQQLWLSGFSRVYSNCCSSCSFEAEIIKIGQSSHKMYSNNVVNFQESMTMLNAWTKTSGNLLNVPRIYIWWGNTMFLYWDYICCLVGWGCRIHRLQWSKNPLTTVLAMTLNNLMVRFQWCWGFGKCEASVHCHCSQVNAGPES